MEPDVQNRIKSKLLQAQNYSEQNNNIRIF